MSRSARSRAFPELTRPSGRTLLGLAVVLVIGMAIGATWLPGETAVRALAPGAAPSAPAAGAPERSAGTLGWAVHDSLRPASGGSHPPPPNSSASPAGTTYEVCNTNQINAWWANANNSSGGWSNSGAGVYACYNFTLANSTFCQPLPTGSVLADSGLNLSVATSPASGIGAAPLDFQWNISVNGGGLPPYLVQIVVYDAEVSYNSTNLTGALNLTAPGLYDVDVLAEDSTCTQTAFVTFTEQVYGSLGPNPVRISATASSTTVPATVTYQVNTSAFPANVTILWISSGTFGQSGPNGTATLTYYVPGTYDAAACLQTLGPNGSVTGLDLACNVSAPVTLGGVSPVTTSVAISNGSYPVNLTYTVNLTTPSTLPNGTDLYLIAYDGRGLGNFTETNASSVNLTITDGCGHPWTTYVAPDGNCTYLATWSLIGPLNGPDAGFLGSGSIFANLTANGTPSLWDPTVSWSYGTLNGSLPFNLSVNLSASGGAAPYSYSYTMFGRSSGAANATWYGTLNGSTAGWNGSSITLTTVLNRTGVYYASYFVADSDDSWVGFALPLIVLGNVSPLSPLGVTTGSGAGGGGGGSGSEVPVGVSTWFVAEPSGGLAPYTIQWSFGDGTYGSSVPGEEVAHAYGAPGTYDPTVTVTDARGRSVTATLPAVTVVPASSTTGPSGGLTVHPTASPTGTPAADWAPLAVAGVAVVVLSVLGLLSARREVRRQGEALVATLEPTGAGTPDAPGRTPP